MNEFELIAHLTHSLPSDSSVLAGVGEDCAVLDLGLPDRYLLFKTDAVVEGIHFKAGTDPKQIGHKALARCLSDIASMAGQPTHALITLGLPGDFDPDRVKQIYEGIRSLASKYEVLIVGGETTRHPGGLIISISVLGSARKDRCLLRSGARSGDAMFVTGELGGSIAGKHLDFHPRLKEAQWLAERFSIHAMIDLSDGLAGDLPHLLKASQVGAELRTPSIPISQAAKQRSIAGGSSRTPLQAALTDGEDFELLFALPASQAVSLLDQWKEAFPELRLTCIGKFKSEAGLMIRDEHGIRSLSDHGYQHFQ